jgi:putative tryptophan/tyrosine transport system substrate-binding protein
LTFAGRKGPSNKIPLSQPNLLGPMIVAWGTSAVIAARRATSAIPIVMVSVGDPVGTGIIASLARPGGNITGFSTITVDLSAKLLALLVEIVPGIRRIGVMSNAYNPNVALQLRLTEDAVQKLGLQSQVVEAHPNVALQLRQTEDAVQKLGLQSQVVEAQTSEEYERAFARLSAEKVDGVVLLATPSLIEHAHKIAELARAARLPTAFQRRENVEAGGLISYGGNISYQFRQASFYVDRLLKGASPADLPVEQPTKLELVINLKTAKALGLTVPLIMQMTADEMIE